MIDAFSEGPALNYSILTAQEFRAAFDVPAPLFQTTDSVKIKQRTVARPDGAVRVRLYYPEGGGPFPITLYIHGGGFVIGTPETTDGICRTLAARAKSLIVSPDYRLAPEEPFPAGLEDCWATLQWALDNANALDGIVERVAVAGDSSGGNFAAVIAQMARNCGLTLKHQLLLYPVLDHNFQTPSYSEFAQGYFLTSEMMRWFWRQYLPAHAEDNDWRISPSRQETLEGLPAATIITAEYDVLRDEAEAFACRLILSGVPTAFRRYQGQIHGFLLQQGAIDDADAALCAAAEALRLALHA
ncbi:alpha/beta hydrolase [Azospirillum sp. A1-3]|uniref:alpha/beta hydrolase n=1 Tax=Azospirillum sp. A1-3 TaxID=185874 RepID=UPI0020778C2B|nr:alpha/beta hydrolase [Azospirillum sp. A1-3]MCM8735253.1 alpha/beta hydrolase [Azospirillum sp. A1-3]